MFIKKLLLIFISFSHLANCKETPRITIQPAQKSPGENPRPIQLHSSRIDHIKNIVDLNNHSYDYPPEHDPGELAFSTLIHHHKYCLQHWNMDNYLIAFIAKSLPWQAAAYSKRTHFCVNDQLQLCIPLAVQQIIFDQYPLYKSPQFRTALRYLPDYHCQIERVHAAMHSYAHVRKKLGPSTYYIELEHNALQLRKQQQHRCAQLAEKERAKQIEHERRINQLTSEFKRQEAQLSTTLEHYDNLPILVQNDSYCQRINARQQAIYNALKQPVYTTEQYVLTNKQAALLADYGIKSSHYTKLTGNQLQHQIHKELLDWLRDAHNQVEHISTHQWLGAFIDAACIANKFCKCLNPLVILDFAWSAINALASCEPPVFESEYLTALCAAAIHLAKVDKHVVQLCKECNVKPFINGAWKGIKSTAQFLRHPIDSIAAMAYHLSKIISRLDEVPDTFLLGNVEQAYEKAVGIVNDCIQFQIDAARAFVATPEEQIIEGATAFAVETVALQGFGKAVSALASKAVIVIKNREHLAQITNTAEEIVKQVQSACKEASTQTALTAEGIEIAGAEIAQTEVIGGGSQVSKISKYISKMINYILADESAILALAEKCKTFKLLQYTQELGFECVQITEKYLKHIFGIEIEEVIKKSGLVKRRLGGFHHDYLEALEKSGKIEILAKKVNINKISELHVNFEGKIYKGKTHFPSDWTQEKCLIKIQESLNNIKDQPIFNNNRFEIIGKTIEGIEIKTIVEKTGELVTSYPIY